MFRKRIEHRERIFRQFCRRHLSRIVFRLFVLARLADRIVEIRRKVKRSHGRLIDYTHLLVGTHHLQFKNRNRRRRLRRHHLRAFRFLHRSRTFHGIRLTGGTGGKPQRRSRHRSDHRQAKHLFHRKNHISNLILKGTGPPSG